MLVHKAPLDPLVCVLFVYYSHSALKKKIGATGATGATGLTGTSIVGLTAGTYVATAAFSSADTGVIILGSSGTTTLNYFQCIPGSSGSSSSSIININGSVSVGATFVSAGSVIINVAVTIPNGSTGTQASNSCLVITTTAGGTSNVQFANLTQVNQTTFRIQWTQVSTGGGLIVTFNISFDPMITLGS